MDLTDETRTQAPSAPPVVTLAKGDLGEQPDRRLYLLARCEPFREVEQAALEALSLLLQPVRMQPGAIICRLGEPADRFYLVESGSLAVLWESRGNERTLRQLGPGDAFGEIALLRDGVRTATVRAESEGLLWALPSDEFAALCAGSPSLTAAVERLAKAREAASQRLVFEVEHSNLAALAPAGGVLRIGRRPDNDLVFASRIVSGHHAQLERNGDTFTLRDLDSTNGTFVNGARISGAVALHDGDEIWIGDERLIFDRTALRHCVEPHGLRIAAQDLSVETRKGKRLLNGVSLSVLPGEFVAIVGGSGAGKSTLMATLAGLRRPSSGTVEYNGVNYHRNLARFRNTLGYVPQDDIIHAELSVRNVLRYAARLRLPADTGAAEREAVIDTVLEQLALTGQAEVRVDTLSGGQRKRASIAVELLTGPRVFFLDEPTSGLDPATEKQMMLLLRRLADTGSTVILTTHMTKNIALCDKVVLLARGGNLAFAGTPARAKRYFAVDDFDDIYGLLEQRPAEDWTQRFRTSREFADQMEEMLPAQAHEGDADATGRGNQRVRRFLRQLSTLVARNRALFFADKREIITVLAQPILIPLFMLAVFHAYPFRLDVDNPRIPLVISYFLVSSGLLYGISIAIREIVKEYPIFLREHTVNLSTVAYVLAKAIIAAPILMLSEALMVLVLWLGQRMPARGLEVYVPLLIVLWRDVIAAMALGLFVSALVASSDQASRLVPILLVPQLLFSGAILSIPSMVPAGQWISRVMISKWTLDAAGHIVDLNGLFQHGTSPIAPAMLRDYRDTFAANVPLAIGFLAGFTLLMLFGACLALERKCRRSAR